MEETITFNKLANIRNFAVAFGQLGNDYIFSRINRESKTMINVNQPVRVSGITLCLLLKGNLTLEINSVDYQLQPLSLFSFNSSTIVNVKDIEWDNIDAYILFLSSQFIQNININLNTINFSMIGLAPSPIISDLNKDELSLLKGYMELLNRNANINIENIYSTNAARSIIQALLYQLMEIKYTRTQQIAEANEASQTRRLNYVQEFLRLVQLNHCQERSLAFYADKLFISPKYLSRIIKESTGRSAADWIDHFVIQEAKNMLRFTNKNIQQVAYALNFTTQSSFGKFFKHITGMSPSDYQKT